MMNKGFQSKGQMFTLKEISEKAQEKKFKMWVFYGFEGI